MQAIVTGGSGWLGKRLVKALVEGIPEAPHAKPPPVREVVALARTPAEMKLLSALGARPVRGDLVEPSTLGGLFVGDEERIVFHCAGLIHPARFTSEFELVNVGGTRNLLAAAKGVTRFVHVSSNSPCGVNESPDDTFDESAPYRPYLGYGRTKAEAERLVRAAGVPFVILRPPWFYGPGQPPRQSLFFRMIRDGKAPIVGSGENRRSMAYTDDLAQACLLAATHPKAAGETFWIADARPYTMNEIISTIEQVLERDFHINVKHGRLKLPGFVGDVAMVVDTALQAAGLYHQKIHVLGEMNKTIACSIEHARAVLGYDPKVGLAEGMRRSVQALLDEGETL
jgi:nucleoside-diphosphate-sugar epimerase